MKRWLVTLASAGDLPAPGTAASLLTCILLWPVLILTGSGTIAQAVVAAVAAVGFSALAVALGDWAIAHFQSEDPGRFVLDEAAGIGVTLIGLPGAAGGALAIKLAAAFIAFRIFDITKPPPARQLENLPGGWGILMDDIAAGVYANILCQIVLRWIIPM